MSSTGYLPVMDGGPWRSATEFTVDMTNDQRARRHPEPVDGRVDGVA